VSDEKQMAENRLFIDNLKTLWFAANEYSDLSKVISLTREVPSELNKHLNQKRIWEKLVNTTKKKYMTTVEKMNYLDTDAFFDSEGNLVQELSMIPYNIEYADRFVYHSSISNTQLFKNLNDLFVRVLAGNGQYLSNYGKEKILAFANRMFLLDAIGQDMTNAGILYKIKGYDIRDKDKVERHVPGILDEKQKYIKEDGSPNLFLESVQVVNELVQKGKEKVELSRIQIREGMKSMKLSEEELKAIWDDFMLLPSDVKKMFYS
jgi:hypothetical protein